MDCNFDVIVRGRRTTKLLLALIVVGLAIGGALSTASASDKAISDAREAIQHGRYDEAARLLKPPSDKKDDIDAKLLFARVKILKGDLDGADALVRKATARAKASEDIARVALVRGQIEARRGQYTKALKSWKQATDEHADAREARLLRGELLLRLGRKGEAESLLDIFADEYNNGLLQDSTGLTMVGRAVWRLEYFEDANEVLQEATEKDAKNLEAFTSWGELFLEKYNTEDAAFSFAAALKVNPNLPEALLGMVRVHMETDNDTTAIGKYLDKVLALNPTNPDAIVLKAMLEIDVEEYDEAISTLKGALKVNPNHFEAINLMATCHYLKDDKASFDRERRRAFALNPKWAGFYNFVARFGVRVHRYQEAIDFNNKALTIDPDFWPAFVDLGIGYTRIGDDAKGFEYLRKAHENDGFNVRAYNMVNLYEQTMPSYVFVERGPLRFRFHKEEKEVLEAMVPDLAGEAFTKMRKRYRYTPKHKVNIEIFRDVETFSIRSVGLPHISPHGICFGRVVTSRSPSEAPFNWAEVIWHELAHVFHIQMSRSRVPRWFTEGLAEYEAGVARPEWRREQERELLVLLKEDRLYSVGKLNQGFTQAKTITDIIAAYYQSTLVIEFMVDKWGFDAVLKMLRLYGQSKHTPEALKLATKLDIKDFDAAFKKYLEKRFAVMIGSFDPNLNRYTDLEKFEKAAAAKPKDANTRAELAMALFVSRRVDEAEEAYKAALALEPNQPLAHYLASLFTLRMKKLPDTRKHLDAILKGGHDGYMIRLQFAELAQAEGKADEAIDHYTRALGFYPRGIDANRMLAELYLKKGDKALAADALLQVVLVDQMDHKAAHKLMQVRRELGQPKMARDAVALALNINPFDGFLHRDMAALSLETGDPRFAARSYELALKLLASRPSGERAGLLLGLARALHESGDRKGARNAVERAAAAQPDHPELESVRKMIK